MIQFFILIVVTLFDAGLHCDGCTVRVIQDAVHHHVGYPIRLHRSGSSLIADEHDLEYRRRFRWYHVGG